VRFLEDKKKLRFIASLVLFLLLLGTVGYKVLLGIGFLDALYMTVITVSTVGYAEVAHMDNEAKMFSIFLIFVSLGTVGYLFSSIVSSLLEGDLRLAWRMKRMNKDIFKLRNHYIICGAGETGLNAIRQFKKAKVEFIVVEKNEEKIKELVEDNLMVIPGDSTDEHVLERAGIAYAKGLISTLPNDADNVYTVLTARSKNSDLYIVSRAIEENADKKLMRAGANNTISPNEIGGNRMAALILRPAVISFLDVMTHAGDVVLDLESVTVEKKSSIKNLTLREAQIPQKTGLIVLAIRTKVGDNWIFNPKSDMLLQEGDIMVVLGTQEQVDKLKKLSIEKFSV